MSLSRAERNFRDTGLQMSTIDSLAQSGVQPEVKPAGQEAGSWGNSAPLGLAAFAVTTFMLSMINAELMKV